eukprot:CAMPEP_0171179446 /NCGR_PEP_ID=MMETSP0790-20130122/13260_1 /TAXON_ID=2925 /ORGANISM="Alexandrium catenella, Strain OF101" /LENGTH=1221 /DNA_ID=CAMNT_0011644377 /DNA_START=44 /DNA_END=3709 /DNA_ORIENTATION=+
MADEEVAGPLFGKLVRINLSDPVPTVPFASSDDDWQPKTVNGQEGQCVGWEGGKQRVYLVLTFDGLLAKVPEANIETFEPKSAEDGGFDVLWPANEVDSGAFGQAIAESLQSKGYCVVQTFVDEAERRDALETANGVKELEEYRQELEVDYMGRKNYTKVKKLKQDTPDDEPEDALGRCNHQLTNLGLLLVPFAPDYLGFNPSAQSKAVARMKFAGKSEADRLAPMPLSDDDIEEGIVKNHILFMRSRKVCMLYMIDNQGGELFLYPKEGGEVVMPISKNKLVLFDHSKMSYSYKPQGESLAVQAWMLGDMPSFNLSRIEAGTDERQQLMGIVGAPAPDGNRTQIMSMATRYPGDSKDPLAYWTMQMHSSDCVTEWPIIRFDIDLYYSPDPNDVIFGKSYTNHGGFCRYEEISSLDNVHFNISEAEAQCMSLNQRMFCEIGYEALYRYGFDKNNLYGKNIGTYVGDVGSDWHDNTKNFSMWLYDPDYTATGLNSAVVPCRLAYTFGMVGPTMTFDTACSASLYATHHAHMAMLNFDQWGAFETRGALVGGVNTVGPTGHVGNSQGNILTHTGRCFTFDEAADGYQRGEGCGSLYMKLSGKGKDRDDRMACIVGTVSSHDGKSASLTAPSGPAQQVMLRHSLKFSGITAEEISFTECHGTGTALGDPIEMGAIAAVLLTEEREEPLWHTTPKSNISHLESAAGLSGLLKMVLAGIHCSVPPNVHFRKLNPHVDMEGYPRVFQTEQGDIMVNGCYAGCSSFGFGGSNARCDIYTVAKHGPMAKTEMIPEKLDFMAVNCPKCGGLMSYPCGVAIPSNTTRGQHHSKLVRDEFADYQFCTNCYNGDFRYGTALEDLDAWNEKMRVWITGSYCGWSTNDEMEPDGEGGYTCKVVLSETGYEDFHFVTNFGQLLYPGHKRADQSNRAIVGGEEDGEDRHWRISGSKDGTKSGTVYKITLSWGENRRSVDWEPVEAEDLREDEEVLGSSHRHQYFICGSWAQWGVKEMVCVNAKEGIYESTFTVGKLGKEEFYFKRDKSDKQAIHPSIAKAEKGTVPVRGPDDAANGKSFLFRAKKHEDVVVRLTILDGKISVSATSDSGATTAWMSVSEEASRAYHVVGTFNNFGMTPMEEDSRKVYRCRVALADYEPQDFQIIEDEDKKQAYHPDESSTMSGDALTMGPDADSEGKYWSIVGGEPGATVDIVLDLTQEDTRKRVTWSFVNMYRLGN